MAIPNWNELLRWLFVIETAPDRLFSDAVPPLRLNVTSESVAVCDVFTPSTTLLLSVKFVTALPKMPLSAMFVIFMKLNDGLCVDVSEIA